MTGPFAQVGADMTNGFKMYLDEVNSNFAGAKVNLIIEDSQGKPDTAVTKAKKLILEDHVQTARRRRAGAGGLCARAGVDRREDRLYRLGAGGRRSHPAPARQLSLFHPHQLDLSQPHHPLGQWACDQGYKKIVTVAADYAFGYEAVGGFQKAFEDCGGKIIQKIWPPLGTKDFGPYIPTIKADADAVFSLMVGPMPLQFPKQLRASGWTKPIIGGGTSYDEVGVAVHGRRGDRRRLGAAIQRRPADAEERGLRKAYRAKYGKVPSYFSESNYTTAMMIDVVMKQTKGAWPGAEAFIAKMLALKVDAPRGPVSFDDMRNPIQNIYIKKVEKTKMFGYDKDELWNVVIKTYPAVSQFWTYGKDAFLKQPVYSRDFPPCKYCE